MVFGRGPGHLFNALVGKQVEESVRSYLLSSPVFHHFVARTSQTAEQKLAQFEKVTTQPQAREALAAAASATLRRGAKQIVRAMEGKRK